jgi:hypothetical protein
MKIVYLNRGKIKCKSSRDNMLESAYAKDIHRSWVKNRKEFLALGISEIEYVAKAKAKLFLKHGIFAKST